MKKIISIFLLITILVVGGCTSQKSIKTKEKEIKQTKTEESSVEDEKQIDILPVSGTTTEQNINQDNSIDFEQDIIEADGQTVSDDELIPDGVEDTEETQEVLDDSDNSLDDSLE